MHPASWMMKLFLITLFLFSFSVLGSTANLSVIEDGSLSIFPPHYGVTYSDNNTSVSSASHGATFVNQAINKVIYNPNNNFCGSDSFVITHVGLPEPDGRRRGGGRVSIERVTINVSVTCVNDKPLFSYLANKTVSEDAASQIINFTISDIDTSVYSINLGRSTSNSSLLPTNNISLGGSGANRTVTFRPVANKYGRATVTISANDGANTATRSFIVTVNPVNDAPTISGIGTQSLNEDSS
ncbi:hypothetical protein, partial [Shewanella hanedai]